MRKKLDSLVESYGGYTKFAADLGTRERTVYLVCKGKHNTTLEKAFKMAYLLNSTVDELFEDLKIDKKSFSG